ncbi:MAG: hypothetical protein JXR37_30050 [Kiritimatiellae bacterium]|nr:hypothetical protein [Kiritimatiellia bacterium]
MGRLRRHVCLYGSISGVGVLFKRPEDAFDLFDVLPRRLHPYLADQGIVAEPEGAYPEVVLKQVPIEEAGDPGFLQK